MTMDEVMDLAVDLPAAEGRVPNLRNRLDRLDASLASLDRLTATLDSLDRLNASVETLVRRVERLEELPEDLAPAMDGVARTVVDRLDALERDGTLAFLREGVGVAATVARSFSPDDVRLLGANVVAILHTVRSLTQPEILAVAERGAAALRTADAERHERPGLVRSLRDPDVRRGVSLMLAVLGELGHESHDATPAPGPANP